MKKFLFVIFSLILFSLSGFSQSITHDDTTRTYLIHVPASYDGSVAYPLVLNLHGRGSNASQQQFYAKMDDVANTNNFIVVYPNSFEYSLQSNWNIFYDFADLGTDDVGFISALIDSVSADYNIDTNRVYSCGMSMGGFMSYRLACELDDKIVAIASVTGLPTTQVLDYCNNSRTVPILQIHGTADSTVLYAGDIPNYVSVDSSMHYWSLRNMCDAVPDSMRMPDNDPGDGLVADKFTYTNCDDDSEIWFYKIYGGGHTWPNGFPIGPPTIYDFDGSTEIWEFFKNYSFEEAEDTTNTSLVHFQENSNILVYPNPVDDKITFSDNLEWNSVKIYNAIGWAVFTTNEFSNHIDIRNLNAGMYFMHIDGKYVQKFLKK